ncbi:MAG: DUF3303 family protein [Candidatus Thorarchaeota archaeon]|nr:DUF3303 family protein [Candidatus Thorarchaeota archaeon]
MKFLIEWETKPEERQILTKLLKEYKQPEEVKTIFPIHNCVGSGRGLAIAETDSVEALQKMLSSFLDHVSYVVTPIVPVKV